MTKANTPAEVVDRVGSPLPLIITAPMLDTLKHRAYRFRRVEAENAGDATHMLRDLKFQISDLKCANNDDTFYLRSEI
jgi:hypothetical protein